MTLTPAEAIILAAVIGSSSGWAGFLLQRSALKRQTADLKQHIDTTVAATAAPSKEATP